MSLPNSEIFQDLATRLRDLVISLDVAVRANTPLPTVTEMMDLSDAHRLSTTAMLKVVEQLEDQLSRLYRTILAANDVDIDGMYARDFADHMEKIGIVEDAAAWMRIVKLRNRLVHDYPLTPQSRLDSLGDAFAASVILRLTTQRSLDYLSTRGWLA